LFALSHWTVLIVISPISVPRRAFKRSLLPSDILLSLRRKKKISSGNSKWTKTNKTKSIQRTALDGRAFAAQCPESPPELPKLLPEDRRPELAPVPGLPWLYAIKPSGFIQKKNFSSDAMTIKKERKKI
jgi:hypothetical protein